MVRREEIKLVRNVGEARYDISTPARALLLTVPLQRRCIHDENGNIDPVKLAEPVVPRGSATGKKRKSSGAADMEPLHKRPKAERSISNGDQGQSDEMEPFTDTFALLEDTSMVDPMLLDPAALEAEPHDRGSPASIVSLQPLSHDRPDIAMMVDIAEPSPNGSSQDYRIGLNGIGEMTEPQRPVVEAIDFGDELVDVKSQAWPSQKKQEAASGSTNRPHIQTTEVGQENCSDALPMEGVEQTSIPLSNGAPTNIGFTASRESSVLSEAPTEHLADGSPPAPSSADKRQHSSRHSKPIERFVPTGTPMPQRSSSHAPLTNGKSASPDTLARSKANTTTPGRRKSFSVKPTTTPASAPRAGAPKTGESPEDASLRLAMALQASEFGLRRRS
jgi:hypothetical protein